VSPDGHSWQNDAVIAPAFLYGTAWKEDRTPALVELALRMGFRGIDTANQRKHYFEAGVGEGLAAAYRAGIVTRADLFLQTKYTYQPGQDHRLPYDPDADLATQVVQSLASSLEHPTPITWTVTSCTAPPPATTGPSTTRRSGAP
jgi:diketogulonate reductase-like aldo/keto reductase